MDTEALCSHCFEIITYVGGAKSAFIEAITLAKQGKFDEAREKIAEGDQNFAQGHHIHADLIAEEANNRPVPINMFLVHAEDQMMSAEAARVYSLEFIELYEKLNAHGLI